LSAAGIAVLAFALPACAVTLSSGTVAIDGTEVITGASRLSRNGVASAIGTAKPFPGTIACTTSNCGFRTVTVAPTNPSVTITLTGINADSYTIADAAGATASVPAVSGLGLAALASLLAAAGAFAARRKSPMVG